MQVLCVAPVRCKDPYLVGGRGVLSGVETQIGFSHRAAEQADLTHASKASVVVSDRILRQISRHFPQFNAISVERYDHFEMPFLVGWLDISDPSCLTGDGVSEFEKATTEFFNVISSTYLNGDEVRWVNRTLVLEYGEECPDQWFQTEDRGIVVLSDNTTFYGAWGNNLLQLAEGDCLNSGVTILQPILHAQYLWCFLGDVEQISIDYLALLNSNREIKNDLLHGVISLHYELAMVSLMHERTRTEAQPQFRAVVNSILTAWNFVEVLEDVDNRLERLEHIVSGRSELLQREQSHRMDWILFVLAGTTITALALDFIQTAYSEGVDGSRPGGWLMDVFFTSGATAIVVVSLIITAILVVALLASTSVSRRKRRAVHGISRH